MDVQFEQYDSVRAVIRAGLLKVCTGERLQQVPLGVADVA